MALFEVFCAVNRAAIRIPSGSMLAKALFEGDGAGDLRQVLNKQKRSNLGRCFFGNGTEVLPV